MKIILSRKGFDSSVNYGRVASPIFPDGSLVSMPIPSVAAGSIPYGKIKAPFGSVGPLAEDLTDGRLRQLLTFR